MADRRICAECGESFGFLSYGTKCDGCDKLLCSNCASLRPLIVFKGTDDNAPSLSDRHLESFCKKCFEAKSVLDFTQSTVTIEPTAESNGITLIFAHGGGGSRAMFVPYANTLAEQGFTSILFDFPGHGALVEEDLSLSSCVARVQHVLDEYKTQIGGKNIYVGGSFGSYVGFHILHELSDYFQGAVLLDCGQNVGPGASLKAKVGLWFLKQLTGILSNKTMVSLMKSATEKSPANWKLIESTFGAGFFFQQGGAQVECLKAVAPGKIIPRLDMPLLFFNGSKDYRDSENKWLELCKHKDLSYLKVYEGGDHFFSHDSRFVNDLIKRIATFSKLATAE